MHLPPGTLNDFRLAQPYPINTYFWFFEARNNPEDAPLSIWLNGGPGSSSLLGLMQEHGPCRVNPDSNSTELNPWSWNNEVNVLYIDQPVQVGYSYDVLKNGTLNQLTKQWDVSGFDDGVPESNSTFRVGTFPSMNPDNTANTTENAARALWHFAQTWFTLFPEYKPQDDRVSIWTESYGGHYGPAFAAFFQEQNEKISQLDTRDEDGDEGGSSYHYIHLDTLGIINACIDQLVQVPFYPQMAHANTYGIEAINASIRDLAMNKYRKPGGCRDMIHTCRHLAAVGDPHMYGDNDTVNAACYDANNVCRYEVEGVYYDYSDRSSYDIAHHYPDPFPMDYYIGYLNQEWVQSALGVPVNYSYAVSSVYGAFLQTGDHPREDTRGYLRDIGHLLDSGLKVSLMYGDRDFVCNWYGGEEASLRVPYSEAPGFLAAGYADLQTNDSYVGGLVRQHGNFSFARIFQSGHMVPAYQPETAYRVFQRAMFNRDVATGQQSTVGEYTSRGLAKIWDVRDEPPPAPAPVCYVMNLRFTCTPEQIQGVLNGTAVIQDYVVVNM